MILTLNYINNNNNTFKINLVYVYGIFFLILSNITFELFGKKVLNKYVKTISLIVSDSDSNDLLQINFHHSC